MTSLECRDNIFKNGFQLNVNYKEKYHSYLPTSLLSSCQQICWVTWWCYQHHNSLKWLTMEWTAGVWFPAQTGIFLFTITFRLAWSLPSLLPNGNWWHPHHNAPS